MEYVGPGGDATRFVKDAEHVWLARLCGSTCGNYGEDTGPVATQGLALLVTSLGRFEGDDLQLVESAFDAQAARIVWSAGGGTLRLKSQWSFCPKTGVVSRKDRLLNAGSEPVTVFRVQSRFAFPPGRYEVYVQESRWCNENQGAWIALHTGSLRFGCVPGRMTQGGTPYLGLRERGSQRGLAFHVLPCGNWLIEVAGRAVMDGSPFAVVTLGLADNWLCLELSPGASLECPEILIQPMPNGKPAEAAPSAPMVARAGVCRPAGEVAGGLQHLVRPVRGAGSAAAQAAIAGRQRNGMRGACDRRRLVWPPGRRLVRPSRRLAGEDRRRLSRRDGRALPTRFARPGWGSACGWSRNVLAATSPSANRIPTGFARKTQYSPAST